MKNPDEFCFYVCDSETREIEKRMGFFFSEWLPQYVEHVGGFAMVYWFDLYSYKA